MIRILQGDCRDILKTLPDESVHCCVTSPPYWGLRDYGCEGQIGLEPTPEAYVETLVGVFREVKRVLRADGTLWVNLGDCYANDSKWGGSSGNKNDTSSAGGYSRERKQTGLKPKDLVGLPWMVAFALRTDGWYLRLDVIWSKPNGMPESVTDRPTKTHEYLFLLSKNERYYYDADTIREPYKREYSASPAFGGFANRTKTKYQVVGGQGRGPEAKPHPLGRNKCSVWAVATQPYPGSHFATFPPALIEPCILAGASPQACEYCGAPWERVIEPTGHTNEREQAHVPGNTRTKTDSTGWRPTARATDQWQPACRCENAGTARCIVLDPFGGTCTTARVAEQHGRDSIAIELNPNYIKLAEERTDKVQVRMPL